LCFFNSGGLFMNIQVIGLVRFAYISKNGFRQKYKTQAEAREALFAPERMEFRLRMLEEICIRSMRNQTDQDFRLIVLVSLSLPTVYLKRVEAIIAPLEGAVLLMEPRQWMKQVTQSCFRRFVAPDAEYVINFRLDDDDALAVDYIEKLRHTGSELIRQGRAGEPTVIAHSRGIYWALHLQEDGLRIRTEKKPLGLACAMITSPDIPANVFYWNHRELGKYFTLVMIPGKVMFLRSLHGYGDSGRQVPNWGHALAKAEMEAILARRFGFKINDLTCGWSLGNRGDEA